MAIIDGYALEKTEKIYLPLTIFSYLKNRILFSLNDHYAKYVHVHYCATICAFNFSEIHLHAVEETVARFFFFRFISGNVC